MTETSPVIATNSIEKNKLGSCGLPLDNLDVRLGHDSELFVKGPSIMQGYYGKEEETKRAMTQNGYFKTGDIARIDDEGFIYIIGRKKNILILSTGKNVQPEEIETALDASPFIAQSMAIGEGKKMVTALVVPAYEVF